MSLFPMFVKLQGRLVTIIGGGKIAESKIPGLLEAAACIRVIAPNVSPKIAEWIRNGQIVWWSKAFAPGDLQDTHLVIAATSSSAANHEVFLEAEAQKIWCNSVDDIENCHFYYGSIVQRGDLQIAISTNGKSPALAQRIRKELETQFGPEYALWLEWLGAARETLRATSENHELTKELLHRLASRPMFERFIEQSGNPSSGKEVV
ncbi:MAG TPA: bifunctional precorrin-2 dehydrogenase/sirohydrochlorin ferrochelatase [Candidatus Dormibacteraeota bacterium]|nr:bifunctional precorrin-2 dehydrogenase/sirohydrochlorin ferrochelatase [Candidatus Dormibacteraeota bacterium]